MTPPVRKTLVSAALGLAWGLGARALTGTPGAGLHTLNMEDVGRVVVEELTYRVPVSKQLAPLRGRLKIGDRGEAAILGSQAVVFGAHHIDPETSPKTQFIRFADATAGGYFYGKLAENWGLQYAIVAHLAHNVGTRV